MGAAGIAVIRLVGPDARAIARQAFKPLGGPSAEPLPGPGRVAYGQIVDGEDVIDDVVLTVRGLQDAGAGPGDSGQTERRIDLVEVNPHGGVRVVQRILLLLQRLGAELVEPDRLGLLGWRCENEIEREAWADLIHAQTHRSALWLAHQQTGLPGTLRDIADRLGQAAPTTAGQIRSELEALLGRYDAARALVHGASVAIVGPPNAGKSTLANRLFGHARSIVSEQPGTTRDWVAEPAAVNGIPITLVDTAGLGAPADAIEEAAMVRALGRVRTADLVLLVLDASVRLDANARWALEEVTRLGPTAKALLVRNKRDRPDVLGSPPELDRTWASIAEISAWTGQGIDRLAAALEAVLGLADWTEQTPAPWTPRQKAGIKATLGLLPAHPARGAAGLRRLVDFCEQGLI